MTTALQDPQRDKDMTIGTDQRLALSKVGISDALFLSDQTTMFAPKSASNFRNYAMHRKDFLPTSGTSTFQLGQFVNFKIGNESLSNLHSAELHIHFPAVFDTSQNLHPSNPAYNPAAAGAGTFLEFVPFVAERFLAGSGEPFTQSFGTEKLRSHTADGIHVKRALSMDAEGSTKRAAYNNLVGAVPDDTSVDRWFSIPIWLAHGTDDVNFNQLFPIQAFGTELRWAIKAPTLLQLVRSDLTNTANIGFASTASFASVLPECFIRCHYVMTEKSERGLYANLTLTPKGLTYQTMQIARELPVIISGVAASSARSVEVQIKNSQNPAAWVAFGVRISDDLLAVGATADHIDNDTVTKPRRVASAVSAIIRRPDWTNWQPWNTVTLFDGSQRVTPTLAQSTFQNSQCEGMPLYWPGDISTNLGALSFCTHPVVENNGTGHITFSSMNNPKLVIELPAVNSSLEGASTTIGRQVDTFIFERNFCHMKNGNVIRTFNVQD